jgi:hypothetical protein
VICYKVAPPQQEQNEALDGVNYSLQFDCEGENLISHPEEPGVKCNSFAESLQAPLHSVDLQELCTV